jgi:peptide/nickel transport system permease protein
MTVFMASLLIFTAMSLAPGDPAAKVVGARATQEQLRAAREHLGLDQPIIQRYGIWVWHALCGDLGMSTTYRTDVASLVWARVPTTLFLVTYAGILVVLLGISLGILGAVSRRAAPFVATFTGVGIAIPSYVAAAGIVSLFAVNLGWFPVLGAGEGFTDRLWHSTLPAVSLAIGWSAYVTQITWASLREEQTREHVQTARGRGIKGGAVFRRHVLRNAAVPIITASGLTVAGLMAGAVVVEEAFGIDGIASFLVTSVQNKDYNVVEAVSILLVLVFVVVTTGLDALHTLLDPRLRDSQERR